MLEHEYKDFMEQVSPCPVLRERTVERMLKEDWKRAPAKPRGLRRIAAAAAACVVATALSVTAVAAVFPGFREMLFGQGSPVAESLTPVAVESEWDGIRMEMLGAMGDKTNVVAYFTLQDTEGKGRLSRHMTVVASAKLNGEYPELENVIEHGMARKTTVLDYKEETQTALCRFDMNTGRYWLSDSGNEISKDAYDAENAKVNLSVRRIVSSKDDLYFEPVDLAALGISDETIPIARVYNQNGEQPDFFTVEEYLTAKEGNAFLSVQDKTLDYQYDESGDPVVLAPKEPVSVNGVDYAQITAVGFIDGRLHVQLRESGAATDISKGVALYCTDKGAGPPQIEEKFGYISGVINGNEERNYKRLNTVYSLFDLGEDGGAQWCSVNPEERFGEYVFDIGPDELDRYDFHITAYRNTVYQPNLRMSFDLAESLPAGQKEFGAVTCEDVCIDGLTVNSIGAVISGTRGSLRGLKDIQLVSGDDVYPLEDIGTRWEINTDYDYADSDVVSIELVSAGAPIPVDEIVAVRINGEEIPLVSGNP